jgi:hypothetical protein
MAFGSKNLIAASTQGAVAATAGEEVVNLGEMVNLTALLRVTAFSGDAADTLKVWVQASVGGVWFDIGRFGDVAQSAAPTDRLLRILGSDVTAPEEAAADGSLAAGAVRYGPWGDRLRVKYQVDDPNGNSACDFRVDAWLEG